MDITVIGTGNIGSELARALARAGHTLTLANSRGPESLRELADELHARAAATIADAVAHADVIVLSVPFGVIPTLAGDLRQAPASTVIVDMSNHYPLGGYVAEGLEDTTAQSTWISTQIGRPVIKAWNTVFSLTLATKGQAQGHPDRIALPVAGDDPAAKKVVMQLVEDTGFDAVDAGPLSESWRMEPGSPAYCTDLDAATLRAALARADRARLAGDRDEEIRRVYTPGTGIDMVNGVQIYREVTA
ncbi:NADPH-dependent F420 reductase [Streptomyces leeuwenhoekii]|uniref:NADPH-dependent F420 reductase n=1 Tax=Streptomyces leeuwenhoekii TaxID=1437453 RepID=UPI0036F7264A